MRRTLLPALALTIAASALTGCFNEGGTGYSGGTQTIVSRTWTPKTVSLVDTRTGETTWSVDVPVGQQLVYSFSKGTGPNELRPDEIVWGVMESGRKFGQRNNRQPCPPSSARRIDLALRPAPENPGDTLPGTPFEEQNPRDIERGENRTVRPADEG